MERSGSLTLTSKETGSVDIVEGIETPEFDDGPLTVSQAADEVFFESQLSLPSDIQVGDRFEFDLTGLIGFNGGVSVSVELSSDIEIASLGETLVSSISAAVSGSSIEVLVDPNDPDAVITLRSLDEFDISLSQVSPVISGISSTFVEKKPVHNILYLANFLIYELT